jgi:ATP-dependent Zn protease
MLHDDINAVFGIGPYARRLVRPPPPRIEPEPFRRLEMFDRVAAIHESGHCCWNYFNNEPVHSVEITKQGRGGGEFSATPDSGTVELSEDDDLETRVRQDGRILGAILDPATCVQWLRQLPGFVVSRHAQRCFGAKGEFYDRLCGHDDLVVERVINLMASSPAERRRLHEQVEREAEEFVRKHWRDIERLADELFECGFLNRAQIEHVLAKQSEPELRWREDGFIRPPKDAIDPSVELAYHESGHAVVAVALNQKIRKVALDAAGGFCRVSQPPTTQSREALRNYCAVACAGSIAVNKLTGRADWSMGDHQNIETKLGTVSIREAAAILHEARKLAERLVSENWDSVRALARRLHSRGELDGTEIVSLLSGLRAAA